MHQPYSIAIDENGLATFRADNKAEYKALFTELPNIVEYQLEGLVFDFSFERISTNCAHPKRPGRDPRVKPTIEKLVRRFFDLSPLSVLYFVCDSADDMHKGRLQIFNGWHQPYQDELIKISFQIPAGRNNDGTLGKDILGGAIFLINNPLRTVIEAYVGSEVFVYTSVKEGN